MSRLERVVERNVKRDSLEFTEDLKAALDGAQIAIIAVGTPPGEDGSADLRRIRGRTSLRRTHDRLLGNRT